MVHVMRLLCKINVTGVGLLTCFFFWQKTYAMVSLVSVSVSVICSSIDFCDKEWDSIWEEYELCREKKPYINDVWHSEYRCAKNKKKNGKEKKNSGEKSENWKSIQRMWACAFGCSFSIYIKWAFVDWEFNILRCIIWIVSWRKLHVITGLKIVPKLLLQIPRTQNRNTQK